MHVEESRFYIVNDRDIYIVDRNNDKRLLWDLEDDTMAIGIGYSGETMDNFGYMDLMFKEVRQFERKYDAMKEWTHEDVR